MNKVIAQHYVNLVNKMLTDGDMIGADKLIDGICTNLSAAVKAEFLHLVETETSASELRFEVKA